MLLFLFWNLVHPPYKVYYKYTSYGHHLYSYFYQIIASKCITNVR